MDEKSRNVSEERGAYESEQNQNLQIINYQESLLKVNEMQYVDYTNKKIEQIDHLKSGCAMIAHV